MKAMWGMLACTQLLVTELFHNSSRPAPTCFSKDLIVGVARPPDALFDGFERLRSHFPAAVCQLLIQRELLGVRQHLRLVCHADQACRQHQQGSCGTLQPSARRTAAAAAGGGGPAPAAVDAIDDTICAPRSSAHGRSGQQGGRYTKFVEQASRRRVPTCWRAALRSRRPRQGTGRKAAAPGTQRL